MKTRAIVAIACALVAAPAVCAEAQRLLSGYSISTWADWNGVPLGPVYAIAQDPDGYLWIGGSTGVRRFDGVRFFDAASLGLSLPESPAFTLRIARDGALWIGFGDRRGVRVIRKGAVSSTNTLSLSASITELAEDATGQMWAATDRGLFRYTTRWDEIPLAGGSRGQAVLRVHIARTGTLRVGTRSGVQERDEAGAFREIGAADAPVSGISEDAAGGVWVSDPVHGFHLLTSTRGSQANPHGRGYFVFHDSHANLWVGTHGQGLWRVPRDQEQRRDAIEVATAQTGLISNGIWEIAEDRDGNIWVGTNRGLHRLTRHTMTPLVDRGLVRTVEAAPDSGVWLGTAGGVVRLATDGTVAKRFTLPGVSDITALDVDRSGTLWAATGRQVWRVVGDHLHGPVVDVPASIRSIAGDGQGGLWLVDGGGQLQRWREGRLTSVALANPPNSAIEFVRVDRQLRAWLAFHQAPLVLVEPDGSVRTICAADGWTASPQTSVNTIAEDRAGTVWIGTSRGLARYRDGRFAILSRTTGSFADAVRALVVDDLGYLWLGVGTSIVRLDPAEFDKALTQQTYTPRLREFDVADGVAGVMFSSGNGVAARAGDGRLFFVTGRGITMAEPRDVDERLRLPPSAVRIQSVFADDERYAGDTRAVLPPGTSHVRIDYTVPTLTSPERARFRYRLEGFDRGWIDAGLRRQAFYTNLPSGNYRFLVQLQLPERTWTSPSTTWSFQIAPVFYQSLWFYAVCASAVAVAGAGVWRLRVQSLRREMAAVYAERMRLGREIHDTLLQSLAGLALQLDAVESALPAAGSSAPVQLARIRTQMEEHVREVRQSIWDLRSPPPRPRLLAEALADHIKPLVPQTVVLELLVTGTPRPCPTRIERELVRIAREAVINAVRHGKPRHLTVRVTADRSALQLTVQDDGCGFDTAIVAPADVHYGLVAMQERAIGVGGSCVVVSQPGAGTTVQVTLPLRARWQRRWSW